MAIPEFSGKIGADRLANIRAEALGPSTDYDMAAPVLYHETVAGQRFDYLWYPNPAHRRLFVFFSGDALRKKNSPPVFQRWTWARHFPGSCVFVSDPSLYLHPDLGLAWYSGTARFDPLPVIADRINALAARIGVSQADIYAYGSSGGGFAALRFAALQDAAVALAINPQTNISLYTSSNVQKFYDICFAGMSPDDILRDFPDRISLFASLDKLRGKRLLIAQNTEDTHHLRTHFRPFCAALGVAADHAPQDPVLHRILFTVEGGHAKAEDSTTLQSIIALVEAGM